MTTYTLPPLPYALDALEPHIDARTMEIHHGKHHAAYVANLNAALEKHPEFDAGGDIEALLRRLDQVPEGIRTVVRNNGGGHANHSLFWETMGPDAEGEPTGALAAAIGSTFGDLAALRTAVNDAAKTRFGSGWAWLVVADGGLRVYSTPNQDSPYLQGHTPLLGVDVWEHAYYLRYQNRRPDYLDAWWRVVSWREVGRRYDAARGGAGQP